MRWLGMFGKRQAQEDVASLEMAEVTETGPCTIAADETSAGPQLQPEQEPLATPDAQVTEPSEDLAPAVAEPAAMGPAAMVASTPQEPPKADTLLMELTTDNHAGPALSAATLSVLDNSPLPPTPPSHEEVLDQLVKSLLAESRSRTDLAVGAYEKLSDEARQNAQGWRKSARRASLVASTLTAALLVGGMWSAYTQGLQNARMQGIEQQAVQMQAVVLDRDQLRTELSLAHTQQLEASLQLQTVQADMAQTQTELKICQGKLEAAQQAAALQNAAVPATQPSANSRRLPDVWATLLGQ